jgi:hypothetical protein
MKTAQITWHELAVLPHLTILTNLWTEGTKYYSQANHLVKTQQSFCLYASNRIGYIRKNSRTFTKILNVLWFLNLVFSIMFLSFFNFNFYYSCIINFSITILLSLFLPSSLSLLFLCYNPLFALPTTLSATSYPLFSLSSPPSPTFPQSVTTLPLPPKC